jgi:hypothetical protein
VEVAVWEFGSPWRATPERGRTGYTRPVFVLAAWVAGQIRSLVIDPLRRLEPHAVRPGRPWLSGLLVLMALPPIIYFWFIWEYGVSVPYQDDWALVPLLRLLDQGHLTLVQLWAQHLQNRVLFPNLLMLGLLKLTHFNTKVEMFFGAALLVVALLALLAAQRRASSRPLALMIPVAFVGFSLIQYVTALHGYAVSLYLIVAAVALVLLCLLRSEPPGARLWLSAAVLLGLVASYSSLQGMAVWPAGATLLVVRGRRPQLALIWSLLGAGALALYLVGLHLGGDGRGAVDAVTHPASSAEFLLLLAGAVVPSLPRLGLGLPWLMALGGLIWLLAAAVVWFALRQRGRTQELAVPAYLVVLVAAIDLAIVMGRADLGLGFALDSRYTVFDVWLLAAVYLGWTEIAMRRRRWSTAAVAAIVCGICLVQVVGSFHRGVAAGAQLRSQHHQEVALVLHYRSATKSEIHQYAVQDPALFVPDARYLARHHLSVFGSG